MAGRRRGESGPLYFLSYRSSREKELRPVSQWLIASGGVAGTRWVPPGVLALPNELMLPFEWFELMMAIWNELESCQAFVYLDSPDYTASVWTSLEQIGWRALVDDPQVITVSGSNGRYAAVRRTLAPMDRSEKRLWRQLRKNLEPFAVISSGRGFIPYRGRKPSTNHYLLPCIICGEYSLLPKREVEHAARVSGQAACAQPGCSSPYILTEVGSRNRIRYRRPIVAVPAVKSTQVPPRPLTTNELLHLYAGTWPPRFA